MIYKISFDFDCEGEAPHVFIIDASGTQVLEVFEEPICTASQWSWESDDWQAGPLALHVLNLLNGDHSYGASMAPRAIIGPEAWRDCR